MDFQNGNVVHFGWYLVFTYSLIYDHIQMITWQFPLSCLQLVNRRFVCFLMFLLVFTYPPRCCFLTICPSFQSESAYLELEEVPEWLPEVHSLSVLHGGSPAVHCKTPGLSSYRTMWNDSTVNFKLIETPKLSKK